MGRGHMTTAETFGADIPNIRELPADAPWQWLAAGWNDLKRVPHVSLVYGGVFALGALLLTLGFMQLGWEALILAFAGGFLMVGPMVGVGLYEASRRLQLGQPVRFTDVLLHGVRSPGQLAFMGVILFVIFVFWIEIALLLFMMFMGPRAFPPLDQFIPMLLFTSHGLGLLIVGTIAGAALAALVFSVSAISVPLLMVREVDVMTAIFTSLQAVRKNFRVMALWAVLIAALTAFGVVTLFIGMIVVFPLIGHATWHAFCSLVECDENPVLGKAGAAEAQA